MEYFGELEQFDDIEFICEEHGFQCIGLCSNVQCEHNLKLFCMKCIRSGNTCITKEHHELITISEILHRFLKSENEKRSEKIQDIINMSKKYKRIKSEKIIQDFKSIKQLDIFKKLNDKVNKIVENFFLIVKEKNAKKLNNLKIYSKTQKNENDINNFLTIKLPEIEDVELNLKKFVEEGCKMRSTANFVKDIKLLGDDSKRTEICKKLNNKMYVDKLFYDTFMNKKDLDIKIDSILGDFEKKFDEQFSKLEKSLIISKDTSKICQDFDTLNEYFDSDPKNLTFIKDISITASRASTTPGAFCAFKSFNKKSYIVWGSQTLSLDFYDLDENKVVKSIPLAHPGALYLCRHYPEEKNEIDYLITSAADKTVKIWNVQSYLCVVVIKNPHKFASVYSASILFDKNTNKNYIITSSHNDFMKVHDFNGKFIRNFGVSTDNTYFIDIFFHPKNKVYYIINANSIDVKSYTFSDGELYRRYKAKPTGWHMSATVLQIQDKIILVESDGYGFIRLWGFDTGNLIKSISSGVFINLRGICLWNENYLFAASNDQQIKLFDLYKGKAYKSYKEHIGIVCSLEKIENSQYGQCLLSHGSDGKIKIWGYNK